MNCKIFGCKRSYPYFRYYPSICVEGLKKAMTSLSQDSRSPGRDWNSEPPEYEAGVLTTQPRRSVSQKPTCVYFGETC
jgi:hypothetical protein